MAKSLKYSSQSALFVLVVLGFIGVANYLSTKVFTRVDLTENKIYSISPATRKTLKKLDDIINIKVYFSSKNLPPHLKSVETDVRDLLSEYKAVAGRNLLISYEDPSENEDVRSRVRALGIPEIQMQTVQKDKAEVINGFLGIAVLYEDKKEVLPVVQDMRNFEYDMTHAIMKVFRGSTPKIGILKTDTSPYVPPDVARRMRMNVTDQTEKKYQPLYEQLRENYEVKTVDISDGQQIDTDLRTLIVPGGDDRSFTTRDLFEIDQYFMKGGNLIVLVDAVKISFQYGVNGQVQEPRIMELAEHYGARVEKNLVLDVSCGQVQIPQKFGSFQMNVSRPYPYFVRVIGDGFNQENPAVSSLGEVILPWTSSITLLVNKADSSGEASGDDGSRVAASVLLRSSEKSWTTSGSFNLNPQQDWNPSEDQLKRSNLAVHLSGPFTSYFQGKSVPPVKDSVPGDTLSRIELSPKDADREIVQSNTSGQLVLFGDSDFLTQQNATPGNLALMFNIVDWLSLDESLISVRSRNMEDRTIQADKLKEGSIRPTIIRAVNIVLMPLLVIGFGLFVYVRRREKQARSSAPQAPAAGASPAGSEQQQEEKS